MKILLLSIGALVGIALSSNAQTITIDQMTPQIGEVYTQGMMGAYISPGAAGTNQTWDLSGIVAAQTATTTISNPSGLPGATVFPDASYAAWTEDLMQVGYSKITGNKLELIGIYQTGALMTYEDPQTQIEFLLSYGTTYSDTYERLADFNGFENLEFGQLTVVVDGSGTLITPSGTFTDVLRLKQEVESEVIVTVGGEYVSTSTFTSTTYMYVKAGYGNVLASTLASDFAGTASEMSIYLIDTSVGIEKLSPVNGLSIYPVPVINEFAVRMDLKTAADVSFNLYSIDGRKVAQLGKDFLPKGENTCELRLPENTAGGIYLLQI